METQELEAGAINADMLGSLVLDAGHVDAVGTVLEGFSRWSDDTVTLHVVDGGQGLTVELLASSRVHLVVAA
ncbi:hypothetical protein [Zhihengliuella halotolerans]|uniref:hypothetical protein n=1 Tax=Zhihengliuella halotolerans TaxID=370736 RepID=UPI000C801920|nr:hypothetical protein [Zhihengliuella halotolerans]